MPTASRQLQQRAEELEILYDLTSAMAEVDRPGDIYNRALTALLRGTHCARAAILLFDTADVMRFVASRGLSEVYCGAVRGTHRGDAIHRRRLRSLCRTSKPMLISARSAM